MISQILFADFTDNNAVSSARSMLKAGATLESVSQCAGISFAAAARRSGYTTSFRNIQACIMHHHPHAEAARETGN